MRVALLGWDLEHAAAAELGGLGVDVVGVTRWFPGLPPREAHHGWREVRCPHEIGGGARQESAAFGVAVVREASTSGLGFDFDVIHALDWRTRSAAGELAARAPGAVVLGSEVATEADEAEALDFGPRQTPDGWICDHPLAAARLCSRLAGSAPVFTVPTRHGLAYRNPPDREALEALPAEGPCMVLSLWANARFSSRTLIEAVRLARESVAGLVVAVYGEGMRCDRLRRRLKRAGLLSRRWGESCASCSGYWNAALVQAVVAGVASADPVDDPFAQAAWLAGIPVVRVSVDDAEPLGRAIVDAVFNPARRDSEIRAGAALVERRVDGPGVAAEWLRIYLRMLDRKRTAPMGDPGLNKTAAPREARSLSFPDLRSRLTLTPLASREVLASWSVRPDDWRAALEWMGPESVRAVLSIRLFDVTDVLFDGMNAHGSFDVDLSPGENHRTIVLPYDGRSLAACLGVRSQWGYFHPLVHARFCHLPREGAAPPSEVRRLRVIPRRSRP